MDFFEIKINGGTLCVAIIIYNKVCYIYNIVKSYNHKFRNHNYLTHSLASSTQLLRNECHHK